jgi:tetratricopeptide (TPR) repeat protein
MGEKSRAAWMRNAETSPERPANIPLRVAEAESRSRRSRIKASLRLAGAVVVLVGLAAGAYLAFTQYQVARLSRVVRESFANGHYDTARAPLARWLKESPGSGEAYYYLAWQSLADEQPRETVLAVDEARRLHFDPDRVDVLSAIYHARADRYGEAEPILERAFLEESEPRAMVAKALAKIYLSSYRLDRAAVAIERWRALAPEDPQPYLWSNEIASRADVEPAILIQNYRAALERDPDLDKARLGLAQALSKDRRFDEAEQEFLLYLKRNPKDAVAFLGLGRNVFQRGDIEKASRFFESALESNPRDPEALKELGQLDVRLGRLKKACERLQLLVQIQPFDHEIRYSYAQALKLTGNEEQSRAELAVAARLRKEHDEIVQLRYGVLKNPRDFAARFQVARWMMEHGHEDEGLKWTKEILRANPSHGPTHRVLADYYEKHGEAGLANYHRLSATAADDAGDGTPAGTRTETP